MKKICVITDRYPLKGYPVNTFLEQLVNQFADLGVECDVIVPYCPFMDKLRKKNYMPKPHCIHYTKAGQAVNVYSTKFFYLFGRNRFGIDFAKIYLKAFCDAAKKQVAEINKDYDCFYAHFISPAALTAAELGRNYHKPVFFAYGESSIRIVSDRFALSWVREQLASVSGVVAVSTKNKQELVNNDLIPEEKIGVFPNAVDSSAFCVMDKTEVRGRLGIPRDDFVVAFVGHYIHRKGSRRLSAALDQLPGVKSLFIGAGEEAPDCEGILFSGRLPHSDIAAYLNAADVFVLPTLAEGCCNAIVEAMACGLPVISSDLPFNDDILNEGNSIRIDPNNVPQIVDAIRTLRDDSQLRKQKAAEALKMAEALSIKKRAENILAFMDARMKA